jgi:hypothetical protein
MNQEKQEIDIHIFRVKTMGGKAIKIAERVQKEVFVKYVKEIIPRVEKAFGTKVSVVNSFHDKQDFGDLDLLVLADRDFGNRREIIETEFSPQEIVTNSHIVSFNYNELQVDLIFTPEHNWETSKIFFSMGDLGNLMGKLINNYGRIADFGYKLKYGFDGLKCKILHDGKTKTIFLTKDNEKVFEFLGLDFEEWKKGFNNREEMFDYVTKSRIFDYSSFQWENLSSINKGRNKRRPNYLEFLEYIKPYKDNNIEWATDHTKYLKILSSYFDTNILVARKELEDEIELSRKISAKFNGKLIMEHYPKLIGKELGNTIVRFKESKEDFEDYVLNTTQEDIIKEFGLFI